MKTLAISAAALTIAAGLAGAANADTLVEAAERDDGAAALELLRARGADPDMAQPDGTTPLLWATYHEDVALVRALIAAGADVEAANEYGAFPLQEAAMVGNAEILRLLLDAGADPDTANPEGQTALMAVARTGRLDAARVLIAAGADVNQTESWGGQTALMWAVAQGQVAMTQLLIEAGADVNARAVVRDWERHVTAEPRIKELFAAGLTPLLYAAREGCAECARLLAEAGAELDAEDPEGVTPLMMALMNLRFDTAAYLIEAGADIHKWDWYGRTALFNAVDVRTLDSGTGALVDLPDHDGVDIARMLLERGADPDMRLKLMPRERNMVGDRVYNDHILDVGATPLLRAAWGADVEAVDLLLQHGARIDIANGRGVTPLLGAASPEGTRFAGRSQEDIIAVMDLLLARGADIGATNASGQNALHLAIRQSMGEVVRYLADNGAPLEALDGRGRTIMDYATGRADTTEFGNTDVVGVLPEMIEVVREVMIEHGLEPPAVPEDAEG